MHPDAFERHHKFVRDRRNRRQSHDRKRATCYRRPEPRVGSFDGQHESSSIRDAVKSPRLPGSRTLIKTTDSAQWIATETSTNFFKSFSFSIKCYNLS